MTYLTTADMANDLNMQLRVQACAAQQGVTDAGIHPEIWANEWRMVWASSPGWAEAWDSALAAGTPIDEVGARPDVITDQMILSQIQSMMPFHPLYQTQPPNNPEGEAP